MRELKNTIRQSLRQRKDSMKPGERREKSNRICRHLLELINDGETVMVYTSKEKEVDTAHLISALLEHGNPVVVPIIVQEDVSLRLSYLKDVSALIPSTFNVPEPIGVKFQREVKTWTQLSFPCMDLTGKDGESGMERGTMIGSLLKTGNYERSGSLSPARNMKTFRLMNMIFLWIIS